jgi:hypothetical protein
MSPPEVWGPSVWRLFHTLSDKINENVYSHVMPNLFMMIVRICNFLPCPNCANDSSIFLSKINISTMKTKTDFKKTIYLFHNYVNSKKRKPLFNYSQLNIYSKYNLIPVINDFITKYQTKGNMNLLTDSFQRSLVIKDFNNFLSKYNNAFKQPITQAMVIKNQNIDNSNINSNKSDKSNKSDNDSISNKV